jgi:hypothetical protein
MKSRLLVPVALLLVAAAAAAAPARAGHATGAPRPGKTRVYKGRVTVKSSATIPGVLPALRTSEMTISLTRTGRKVEMKVHDPDGLGIGREYTSVDTGCIAGACPAEGVDDGDVDVEFDGPEFRASVEARLAAGMKGNPLAQGMKVELTGARTHARASVAPKKLKLDSTAKISRKPFGGLRGIVAERMVPREITLHLSGELERQPD